MNTDEVFGPDGLLSQKFPGYRPRPGQVAMTSAVWTALDGKKHLVVEGPTGVGKSVAYLVPAIRRARETGEKAIVVTANISLQEQLVGKDLPLLREVLSDDFTFALMKGKNNYLCPDALGKAAGESLLADGSPNSKQMARLMKWATETTTGDVSEFPEVPSPANWKKLSTTSEECKGSACKSFAKCFAEKAKKEALAADIVVTNYHLFFAHLLVREKMKQIQAGGGEVQLDVVLPPATVVICDEAHKMADIARDFLGFQVSLAQVEWLVRGFNHDLAGQALTAARAYFATAAAFKRSRSYKARLKKGHPLDGTALSDVLDRVSSFYKQAIGAGAWSPDEKAELEIRMKRSATLAANVRQVSGLGAVGERLLPGGDAKQSDLVFFLEETERGACVVKSKPIEVGPWMARELFGSFASVVVTSATLATGSGSSSFAFVKKEIGLKECAELVAESPFKYGDNVMVVIPHTMAMPDDRDAFPGAVARHFTETVKAAKGRTLGLFTSYKNLELAHTNLLEEKCPYRILKHGDAPRSMLTKQFRDETSSVLLGSESFWAGVDVPGESLSCVVIDRLPFPTPDDPVVDAIAEKDDRWFFNYAVPRAIIQFKQGFGRLIRSETDRGVVVVLDRRLVEKGYGRSFLSALPPTRIGDDVDDVEAFLGTASGGA